MFLEFLKAKNDYIKASKRAEEKGLALATGGNISTRIPGNHGILIKPSGIALGDAEEENFIITDLDGNLLEGNLKPTKETILHGGIYKAMPYVGGIVHVHPIYSILCANCLEELPLVTKQMKQITEEALPVCKIKNNTVDQKGLELILQRLNGIHHPCGVLLEEHGVVAFAKDVMEAEYVAELIEENAKVYWNMCLYGGKLQ